MSPTGDQPRTAPSIVVFDIGEVLVDETRVWSAWADILGVSQLSFAAVLGAAIVQGLDYEDAFAEIAPNVEWQAFTEEHERRYGGFREADLYADVRPCLEELHAAGTRVVIAGNQPARRTPQLHALGLPATAIATSDDIGADKPDPDFFAGVMELAGTQDPADVLYVGDRVDNDVLPAAAHGMHTCWLQRGPWGLLQSMPEDGSADLVLEGLGELPTLLADWRRQPGPDDG